MIKWALPALLGFLCLCNPLVAQEFDPQQQDGTEIFAQDQLRLTGEIDTASALARYRPDLFSTWHGKLLLHGLPVLTLLDGRRFPISGDVNGIGFSPLESLPVGLVSAARVQKESPSPMDGTDAPGGIVDLRLNNVRSGGEMGVFYGGSGGQFGRQDFETYIHGSVGNDHLQISAGAAYQNSRGRSYSY